METMPSPIEVRDEVVQLVFERFGVHNLTKEEKVYRDAMESVSLALEEKGMPLDDILDVLNTAIDGFENSEVKKIQAALNQSLTDDQQKVLTNLLVLAYHDGYDSGYDHGSADGYDSGYDHGSADSLVGGL